MKLFTITRTTLLYIFIVTMVLQIFLFSISAIKDTISYEILTTLAINLLKVYAVHLSVIASTYFFNVKNSTLSISLSLHWTAIILVAIWNAFLLFRSLIFFYEVNYASNMRDTVENLLQFHNLVADVSSFLIVGLISYFFQDAK